MELRQLECFLAVAEELHFGHAAERLFIAQQSVSEQIRRLEREIGAPLLHRTSRRVTLTTVGEALLPEARRALTQTRHALHIARAAAVGAATLSIGYAPDAGRQLLRRTVPALRARYPNLAVHPRPLGTYAQLDALRAHQLDLGIVWNPELTADLDSLLLTNDAFMLALPVGHPLADETDPVHDASAIDQIAIWPRNVNRALHDAAINTLNRHHAHPRLFHEAIGLDRQLDVLLAGSAAITVASIAAHTPTPDAVYRPFAHPGHAHCHLVWHADRADTPTIRAFLDATKQQG